MKRLEKDSQRARVKQLLNYATLEGTSASEGARTALACPQLFLCVSNMQPLHTVARKLLQQVRPCGAHRADGRVYATIAMTEPGNLMQ